MKDGFSIFGRLVGGDAIETFHFGGQNRIESRRIDLKYPDDGSFLLNFYFLTRDFFIRRFSLLAPKTGAVLQLLLILNNTSSSPQDS